MNYKIIILLLLVTSCTNQNLDKKKITDNIIYQKYSNNGFTLIYSDNLFNTRIVNKKLNERDLLIFQKNLKKNTSIKITNLLNNKSVLAKVSKKSKYPSFYNSVITSRIANEIDLNLIEPYVHIESVDQNSVFYAGKQKHLMKKKMLLIKPL